VARDDEAKSGDLVVIAIPSYRRPQQLSHLLERIDAMPVTVPVRVLVADNDAIRGDAMAVVESISGRFRHPLAAILVPEQGLAHVRNELVATALAIKSMSHLAFIDDDEWPEENWLSSLLSIQRETRAAVTGGPVRSWFTAPPPRWTEHTFLFRPEERNAGPTGPLWASNNLLITREILEKTPPPWFDARFNRTGGEDMDLLTRWHNGGWPFAWAPDAAVVEEVPAERARIGWATRRMWRVGITDILVARKAAPGLVSTILLMARSLALLALRTTLLPLALVPSKSSFDHYGKWIKSLGRIAGLMGDRYEEYR
jgi:succinoglycan biosynthesis protein ExoM